MHKGKETTTENPALIIKSLRQQKHEVPLRTHNVMFLLKSKLAINALIQLTTITTIRYNLKFI